MANSALFWRLMGRRGRGRIRPRGAVWGGPFLVTRRMCSGKSQGYRFNQKSGDGVLENQQFSFSSFEKMKGVAVFASLLPFIDDSKCITTLKRSSIAVREILKGGLGQMKNFTQGKTKCIPFALLHSLKIFVLPMNFNEDISKKRNLSNSKKGKKQRIINSRSIANEVKAQQ